jgi:hypothetical protein
MAVLSCSFRFIYLMVTVLLALHRRPHLFLVGCANMQELPLKRVGATGVIVARALAQ